MKIIEALKQIKDLKRKADDIRSKIADHCADMDADTPAYNTVDEQRQQIASWLQSHHDIVKEIETLRLRIQKTNLAVMVSIDLSGKMVTKEIAAWIHRRKDLAAMERAAWYGLSSKRLQPMAMRENPRDPNSEVSKIVQVRKYYDQKERDTKVEEFTAEPAKIDAALEITNATTDMVD